MYTYHEKTFNCKSCYKPLAVSLSTTQLKLLSGQLKFSNRTRTILGPEKTHLADPSAPVPQLCSWHYHVSGATAHLHILATSNKEPWDRIIRLSGKDTSSQTQKVKFWASSTRSLSELLKRSEKTLYKEQLRQRLFSQQMRRLGVNLTAVFN